MAKCANLCGLLLLVIFGSVVALFLWFIIFLIEIELPRSDPILSIQQVYIPALNIVANDTANTTIILEFKLENPNEQKGIYYRTVKVSLYYGENELAYPAPVATFSLDRFYQGYHKKAYRTETVQAVGVPWDVARNEVLNGTAVFRIDMTTTVSYRITFVKYSKHKIAVGGNLRVDDQGSLVKPDDKGLKLSSASLRLSGSAYVGLLAALILLLLSF